MSADNFFFVESGAVYHASASDYDWWCEQERRRLEEEHRSEIDRRFRESITETKEPVHRASSNELAEKWALGAGSEYGVWWVNS